MIDTKIVRYREKLKIDLALKYFTTYRRIWENKDVDKDKLFRKLKKGLFSEGPHVCGKLYLRNEPQSIDDNILIGVIVTTKWTFMHESNM